MNNKKMIRVNKRAGAGSLVAITLLGLAVGCHKPVDNDDLKNFQQVNLVANTSEYHPKTVDKTLINAFGIAWSSTGIAWVNSVGGHVSELYSQEGDTLRRVNIPFSAAIADSASGFPCGIVNSSGKNFILSNGPAAFLFTGFEGVLSGWNGASGNNAKFLKHPPGASYTGLAIGVNKGHNLIYAANFGKKKIDVWDTLFNLVNLPFRDNEIPDTYSPYNIQAVGDFLFVMYAELATSGKNAGHGVAGAGKGYVSVFNTDGTLAKHFASKGTLNVPWGVTEAPASFLEGQDMESENSGHNYNGNNNNDPKDPVILVGNFGDGRINVFTPDGRYLGQLKTHNHTIVIDGLWSLSFAPNNTSRLYFTAGPDEEADGVFGYLIKQ